MVPQTLNTLGPLHGYGIAGRIEQVSGNEVLLKQSTIYAYLVRLQQSGWICAGKFYSVSERGGKKLSADATYWQRLSIVMNLILTVPEEEETKS